MTTSTDLISWTPFQQIRVDGYDHRKGNIYFFAAQVNPVDAQSLIAFFPLEHLSGGCVCMATSRDGLAWSEATPILRCPVINFRAESHPAAGLIMTPGSSEAWLYVQTDVPLITLDNEDGKRKNGEDDDAQLLEDTYERFPYLRRNGSRLLRYSLPAQMLRDWTRRALWGSLRPTRGDDPVTLADFEMVN